LGCGVTGAKDSSHTTILAAKADTGEISGSHGDEYEDGCLLECCAV
jgi:hypothetical protein